MEKEQGKGEVINGDNKKLLKLSRREGEVLVLVAEGKMNQEIAEELFLSVRTIETHRYNICEKLGLSGPGALQEWLSENWKGYEKE